MVISGEDAAREPRVESRPKKSRSSRRTTLVSDLSWNCPAESARNFVSNWYTVYAAPLMRWLWLETDSKFGASGLTFR